MVTTPDAQLPVTPAGNPENVAPVAPVVAYVILVMAVLIHTVCVLVPAVEVKLAVVSGFTVTVAVMGISAQVVPPLVYDGVIVNVTVTGAAVVLVSVPLILPVPLAAIPVTEAVLSLVQLYTVPVT